LKNFLISKSQQKITIASNNPETTNIISKIHRHTPDMRNMTVIPYITQGLFCYTFENNTKIQNIRFKKMYLCTQKLYSQCIRSRRRIHKTL